MSQMLTPGEPAPWFHAAALARNPRFAFHTAAGRWIVMLFLGSASREEAALQVLAANRDLFDDEHASFFGVTVDPEDAANGRIVQVLPGIRWFLDYDREVSAAYGAIDKDERGTLYKPHWLLLDPMLRVRARAPIQEGGQIMAALRQVRTKENEQFTAPVLVVPGIFPPDLCQRLIKLHETNGGFESGFMRDVDGITTVVHDRSHKRRSDLVIEDQQLIEELKGILARSLRPMIQRAFQFNATRIERWLVASYSARDGGHFRAHRDNTTAGTAHRKFACTVNLNANEYEGGDLCFPEFGRRTYRAPSGGAVVFSSSLLHEARPVTQGVRYAFLPFFYDDDGARVRERNLAPVAPELQNYSSGLPPR